MLTCDSFHTFHYSFSWMLRLKYTMPVKLMRFLMLLAMTRVLLLFACYKVTLEQIVFRSNTASSWNSQNSVLHHVAWQWTESVSSCFFCSSWKQWYLMLMAFTPIHLTERLDDSIAYPINYMFVCSWVLNNTSSNWYIYFCEQFFRDTVDFERHVLRGK
jgi:hypothetical protein